MGVVQKRIRSNWNPSPAEENNRIVVLFTVNRQGTVTSKHVTQSSGSQKADNAALFAIEQSSPFAPLPPDHKEESVDIQFTFDYEGRKSSK